MPEIKNVDVRVAALKKGDVLADTNVPVVNIERKVKWAIVHFPHDAKVRWEQDRIVTVKREVQTEEEKAAAERDYVERHVMSTHDKWLTNPGDTLIEKISKATVEGYRELVDYGSLATFLKAQALYKIAMTVEYDVEHMLQRDVPPEGFTRAELVAAAYHETTKRDPSRYNDPTSRSSSSVTSNLIEDCDVWARRQVLEDMDHWTFSTFLQDSYDRLTSWFEENKES